MHQNLTSLLSDNRNPMEWVWFLMEALNLRCNKITRAGAKPLLHVMQELSILRLVDLRDNLEEDLLGVLECGEHYIAFSKFQVINST